VLGKLLATSLRAFYALLATFPVLALTLLMGGVTGGQFWMTLLALVDALVVSLAAGLFVSAISRDSQKALAATLFLLFVLVAGGPAVDGTFAAIRQRSFIPILSLTSPGYLFVAAGAWGQTPFWPALLANQAVGGALFGLACLLLPRTWQEKAAKISTAGRSRVEAWKFGGAKSRRALRRKLIEPNPVLWLACRERWQAWAFWGLTILIAGGLAATSASRHRSELWMIWSYFGGLLTLVLYLGIASQAGRFFVEAQRSGLTELLLATPLTVNQIVQGQWRALRRRFGAPLAVWLAVQLLGAFLAQQAMWNRLATVTPPTPGVMTTNNAATNTTFVTTSTVTTTPWSGTATVSIGGFSAPGSVVTLAVSVAGMLTVAANLVALSWFGMWMGLNSKNTNLAALKSIVFVQVIPWFVVSFASAMMVPLLLLPRLLKGVPSATSQMMTWYPLLASSLATVLYLAKDIGFSFWARRKLYSEFREQAARSVSPIRPAVPTPWPQADAPPVIAPT
jgi:hypothetical protein